MLGRKAAQGATALVRLLEDKYQAVQLAAATSLGQIGSQATDVVPEIIPLLSSNLAHTQDSAIKALGAIGPSAHDAAPALTSLMADPTAGETAATSLVQMGASLGEHVPLLARHLKSDNRNLRLLTIRTLCEIGKYSESARNSLQECLGDSDRTIVEAARQSLERIQRLTGASS